jgi:CBS domain-containing protein
MEPAVVVEATRPVAEVAAAMTRSGATAAVVVDGASVAAIVTDADVRSRHVATGGRAERPVSEIATTGVRVVAPGDPLAEALGTMASAAIHHLVVVDGGEAVGMIDAGRVLAAVAGDPLRVLGSASSAGDVTELAAAYRQLPSVAGRLLGTGSGGLAVARLLSLFAGQAVARVAALARDELGAAPAPYALMALGSLARGEQTLVTDQDHALVLADGAGGEPWFAEFGQRVTDLLAAVGYPRCPGGVMIANPDWRDEASAWRRRWGALFAEPSPEHVLASNIVLDARCVDGDGELAGPFLAAADRARASGNFVLFLANSARRLDPPLGLLRRWKLQRRGPHAGAFDIKRGAIVPIVQIARVHGLVAGSRATATGQRLSDAAGAGRISAASADVLANGYELATTVRLFEQVARAGAGGDVDNWVEPSSLSAWQEAGLKEVCRAIRVAQDAISLSYLGAHVG